MVVRYRTVLGGGGVYTLVLYVYGPVCLCNGYNT